MSLCVIKLSAIALLLCVANSAPVDKRQTSSDFGSVDNQQADSPNQDVQNSAGLSASNDGQNGDSVVSPPGADGQFNAGSLTSQTDGQASLGAVDPSGSEQINSGVATEEQGQGVEGQYDLGAASPEQGTSQFSGLEDPTQGGFNPVSKRQAPEAADGNEQTQVSLDAQSPAGEGQEPLSALTGQEGTGSDSSQFVDQVQQDQGVVGQDNAAAASPEQDTSQFSGLEDPTQGGFNPVSKRQAPEAADGNEQTQVSLDTQSPAGEGQEPLSALTGQEGTGSDSSQFVDQVQQDQVAGDSAAFSPELQVPSNPQFAQTGQEGIESGSSPSLGQVQQDQDDPRSKRQLFGFGQGGHHHGHRHGHYGGSHSSAEAGSSAGGGYYGGEGASSYASAGSGSDYGGYGGYGGSESEAQSQSASIGFGPFQASYSESSASSGSNGGGYGDYRDYNY